MTDKTEPTTKPSRTRSDETADRMAKEEQQGFRGNRMDDNPLEDYTVAGVLKAKGKG